MNRPERDRGTVAMFTTIFAVFVLMLAGLLVDGGLAIHARQRAFDIAEQAARAAADDVDVNYLRQTGKVRIVASDEPCGRARLLAAKYHEVSGEPRCSIAPDRQTAYVTVTIKARLQLLSAFGFHEIDVPPSTASAHPQEGI